MLLQRLKEYNDRIEKKNPIPPMYKKTPVPWLVELDGQGNFQGLISTTGGGKRDKGKEFVIPYPGVKTSGIKPNLLADTAEYALGVPKDSNTENKHRAFVKQVYNCAITTAEPPVEAVFKFLSSTERVSLSLPDDMTPGAMVAFRVNGMMPSDLPTVKSYWLSKNSIDSDNKITGQCIICGSSCTPVNPHPVSIKPIPQGQPAGLAFISANSTAYESYGLEKSNIAPTCRSCAEGYGKGANALLQNESNNLRVGPLVYIFWTKEETDVPILSLLTQPKPEPDQVKKLIESVRSGYQYDAMDDQAFYASALSASNARVAVRDWLETTVGKVRVNISRWFNLQQLVDEFNHEGRPYGVFELAASLYRPGDANQQMTANVPKVILNAALKGGQLPHWMLYQAVKRNRTEQKVTRARLALIKTVLLSKFQELKEEYLVQLDLENMDPAYLCGRLLAELENIQKSAINPNTTIVDRYYGTASSAPASVFGHLLRGAQAHLGKLKKEKPGLQVIFQQRLEEIQSKLVSFPRVLNMEQQGYFALGYYHQRAHDRKSKKVDGTEN